MISLVVSAVISSAALGAEGARAGAAASRVAEDLPTGQLVARVACLDDPNQSYALYLPSGYTADRTWPVLYAFDPNARGLDPTRLFQPAAERLGYVVVCSNNSRNGPMKTAMAAANAVWRDTHRRFSLDGARIYATGFSGGTGLAVMAPAAGVIACGGALQPDHVAQITGDCAWFGAAGIEDFNYAPSRALVKGLVSRGVVARFAGYDGGHQWPPEPIATLALEFIHLSAMRSGDSPRDPEFIQSYVERGRTRAKTLIAQSRADLAAEEFDALVRELAGLVSTEDFVVEAQRLRETSEALQNRQIERELAVHYEQRLDVIATLFRRYEQDGGGESLAAKDLLGAVSASRRQSFASGGALDDGGEPSSVGSPVDAVTVRDELWRQIDRLNRECGFKPSDVRVVATRISGWLYRRAFAAGLARRDEGKFALAVDLFDVAEQLSPTSDTVVYEIARTYAAEGSKKRALRELRRAIELGFKRVSRLGEDPEWAALRAEQEFDRLRLSIEAPAPKTAR